jgi:lactoylglutathione lyase
MRFLHTMIRVGNLERSIDFYTRVLGMELLRQKDFPDGKFTLAFLGYGPEETHPALELTYNWGVERYDLGDGYGHLAVSVDDLDAEYARLSAAGLAPRDIVDFKNDGVTLARFFFIADPDGYQIEVLQRAGRFQ